MAALIYLIDTIFWAYRWILILSVASSWLIQFGIINYHNATVRQILHVLEKLTEPVLAPIRKALPAIGGLDFSPLVALVGLEVLRIFIFTTILPALLT